jgi:hypothetical protein
MRLLVCGACDERVFVNFILDGLRAKFGVSELIHGGRTVFNNTLIRWACGNNVPMVWTHARTERYRNFKMFTAKPDLVLVFGPVLLWDTPPVTDQVFYLAREAKIPIGIVDELSSEIHTVGRGWGALARRLAFPKLMSTYNTVETTVIIAGAVEAFGRRSA